MYETTKQPYKCRFLQFHDLSLLGQVLVELELLETAKFRRAHFQTLTSFVCNGELTDLFAELTKYLFRNSLLLGAWVVTLSTSHTSPFHSRRGFVQASECVRLWSRVLNAQKFHDCLRLRLRMSTCT